MKVTEITKVSMFNKFFIVFSSMHANGHLQVVVADFEERQCPIGHDGQERSGDNAPHLPRNAIYSLCLLRNSQFFVNKFSIELDINGFPFINL